VTTPVVTQAIETKLADQPKGAPCTEEGCHGGVAGQGGDRRVQAKEIGKLRVTDCVRFLSQGSRPNPSRHCTQSLQPAI